MASLFSVLLCFAGLGASPASQPIGDKEIVLKETQDRGTSIEVTSQVNIQGKLTEFKPDGKQGESTAIWASGSSRYRERILDAREGSKETVTARRYLTAALDKKKAESKQRIVLRPAVERVVCRHVNEHTTIFSPDGPLIAPELDLVQADAFTASFAGLLPEMPVKIGDQWSAQSVASAELTGVEPIQSGALSCTLREVKSSAEATVARVNLSGTLTGPTDQGPTRMTIDGHFLFDLDTQLITYILVRVESDILDPAGRVSGQLEGRYEITRRPAIDDPRLTDAALAELNLKPTAESTALLFESTELGLRMIYPRNWEMTSVMKNVLQLDEPTGGSMRLTIDTTPAPTADRLRGELVNWLKSQKAKVGELSAVEQIALSGARKAERFSVRAVLGDKAKEWTYLLIRREDRTATVAVNLIDERTDALKDDVLFIAGRLEFLPKAQLPKSQ